MKDIELSKTCKWKFSYPQDELLDNLKKSIKEQFGEDEYVKKLYIDGEEAYWVMEDVKQPFSRYEDWKPKRKLSLDEYEYYLHMIKVIEWRSNELSKAQNDYYITWEKLYNDKNINKK